MQYKDLPEKWKSKIADYLRDNGKEGNELNSHDFEFPVVDIKLKGSSFIEIQHALVIDAPEFREVIIFTEDSEYHIFNSVTTSIDIIDPEKEKDFYIQKLQERNERLNQLNYIVSHDLKAPLHTIQGFSHLLRRDSAQFSKKHLEYLDFIIESCDSAINQVGEHLNYSLNRYIKSELVGVDLVETLSNVKKNLARQIEDAQIVIDAPDNFPKVLEQKAMLFMLFRDFMSIATQYKKTEEEKASVLINWKYHNNEYVKISIKYKGIDIEKSYRKETHDSGFYGLFKGPSLYANINVRICKRIIEHQGGQLWIEPERGIDTIFFTLKLF